MTGGRTNTETVGRFWTVFWMFDGRNAGIEVVVVGVSLQIAWLAFLSWLARSWAIRVGGV